MHDLTIRIHEHRLMDGSTVSDVIVKGADGFIELPATSDENALKLYYAIHDAISKYALATVRDV